MNQNMFTSLQDVVDYINDYLKCPVTIEDGGHRLLAYSKHDIKTDPARIETIVTRQVPQKVIHRLWENGIIQQLNESHEPIRIDSIDDVGLGNRIAISIRHQQEVLGYIWIIEFENVIRPEGLVFISEVREAVKTFLLQIREKQKEKVKGLQQFFLQLLNEHLPPEKEIENVSTMLNRKFPTKWNVVVFRFQEVIGKQIEKQLIYYFQSTHSVNVVFSFSRQEELIVFLNGEKCDDDVITGFIEETSSTISQRFSINVEAGIGQTYHRIEHVSKSYAEAVEVIRLKTMFQTELQDCYRYQSLGIYKYLDVIIEKKKHESSPPMPLVQLLEYDKKNQTELILSLEAFLTKDCNVNEAAKLLHIHPNTLTYRIKRIVEITKIDLRNPNEKLSLYLELKLLRYSG